MLPTRKLIQSSMKPICQVNHLFILCSKKNLLIYKKIPFFAFILSPSDKKYQMEPPSHPDTFLSRKKKFGSLLFHFPCHDISWRYTEMETPEEERGTTICVPSFLFSIQTHGPFSHFMCCSVSPCVIAPTRRVFSTSVAFLVTTVE